MTDLPFALETDVERGLASDPEWRAGIEWGEPRSGHPEGEVKWHVADVLANVDRLDVDAEARRRLRIAALVHDTWKRAVDREQDRVPPNEHGFLAARWLEQHIEDEALIALVELHDEGYRAWRAHAAGRDDEAASRIGRIVSRLPESLPLFVAFYWADNRTGAKTPEQVDWFVEQLAGLGAEARVPAIQEVPAERS